MTGVAVIHVDVAPTDVVKAVLLRCEGQWLLRMVEPPTPEAMTEIKCALVVLVERFEENGF